MQLISKLLIKSDCELGEGPVWNHLDKKLYWVDIEQGLVHIFEPSIGNHETIKVNQNIGAVIPASNEMLLLALKDGLYSYHHTKGLNLLSSNPENDTSGNRFNDGKCDPAGRLWIGTMGDKHTASLYRLDSDLSLHRMESGVTTSNGLAWSPDQSTMYYIDTNTRKVMAYTYASAEGSISAAREAIVIPERVGLPDGCTIDSEGMLWIALWGGYAVGRWNPATGKLLCVVDVPAKQVTSCTFGGEAFDTLFITTARTGLTKDELSQYPDSGGVFTIKPGVTGLPVTLFKICHNERS